MWPRKPAPEPTIQETVEALRRAIDALHREPGDNEARAQALEALARFLLSKETIAP